MNSRFAQWAAIALFFFLLAAAVWLGSRRRSPDRPITATELRVAGLAGTLEMYAAENSGLPPQPELVAHLLQSPTGKVYLRNRPRIVRNGAVYDQWMTPIRFDYQTSSTVEVRSAGMDRAFDSRDDLVRVSNLRSL